MKAIEEKADDYTDSLNLEDTSWYGDIHTAYTYGYLQCESDLIIKLWKTEQFTVSKIAEMLDRSIMEVRNALNYTNWK